MSPIKLFPLAVLPQGAAAGALQSAATVIMHPKEAAIRPMTVTPAKIDISGARFPGVMVAQPNHDNMFVVASNVVPDGRNSEGPVWRASLIWMRAAKRSDEAYGLKIKAPVLAEADAFVSSHTLGEIEQAIPHLHMQLKETVLAYEGKARAASGPREIKLNEGAIFDEHLGDIGDAMIVFPYRIGTPPYDFAYDRTVYLIRTQRYLEDVVKWKSGFLVLKLRGVEQPLVLCSKWTNPERGSSHDVMFKCVALLGCSGKNACAAKYDETGRGYITAGARDDHKFDLWLDIGESPYTGYKGHRLTAKAAMVLRAFEGILDPDNDRVMLRYHEQEEQREASAIGRFR